MVRNSHGGTAFRRTTGGVVLDMGCGVGQYAVKTLLDQKAAKVVALDLTHGVDVLREIVHERDPQLRRQLLMVQGSVFLMPFAPGTFDYVYSFGVLMHTGQTLKALSARVTW